MTKVCGTGGWAGPLPGDPDNNVFLSASPAFGGIDVTWTYPGQNPQAVAHTLLYRANSPDFGTAVQRAVVAGNFFYDKLNVGNTYFYWIQIVSINGGPPGELIGPASAQARPLIGDLLEILTNEIQEGQLAENLRTHIGDITRNYAELQAEILDRFHGDDVLSSAVSDVDDQNQATLAFVASSIKTLADRDTALAQQVDAYGVLNDTMAGLITDERQTRIDEDDALALRILSLEVAEEGGGEAAVKDILLAKIGYSAINDGTGNAIPYDGDNVTIVYPVASYPTLTFPAYAVNRKRIIDKEGVDNWNATPAGVAKPLIWVVGLPMASAVRQVGVTGPDGQYASLENSMVAQKDLNGKFKAMYTAKVDVNGLIGGFAIFNDGAVVEAGFDVHRFWIGKQMPAGQAQTKRFPFMVINGEVFMDQAVIYSLTFTKLRDEAGNFMVENGKLKTQYIDTRGMVIRDEQNQVVFSAASGLDFNRIFNKPAFAPFDATRNKVWRQPTMPDPAASLDSDLWFNTTNGAVHYFNGGWWWLSADITANSIAAGIANQGALATQNGVTIGENVRFWNPAAGSYDVMKVTDFVNKLSKISSGTISAFFETLAIGNAYIGNAAVETLNIKGNNVTVPDSAYSPEYLSANGGGPVQSLTVESSGAPALLVFGAHIYSSQFQGLYMRLMRDGMTIFQAGPLGQTGTAIQGEGMETATILDRPSAGWHTYLLEVRNAGGAFCSAQSRCITYLEVKR